MTVIGTERLTCPVCKGTVRVTNGKYVRHNAVTLGHAGTDRTCSGSGTYAKSRQTSPGLTIELPTHILISAKRAVEREVHKMTTWLETQENARPSEQAMTMTEVEYLKEFLETVSKAREGK